ncbi:MAG: hypothetical protein JRE64_11335 [Deltaproteobacteria bacterium]|nr:hypothetical protein [Deltaproteobacteria bacterium]
MLKKAFWILTLLAVIGSGIEASGGKNANQSFISLFKCIAAGDYYYFCIFKNKSAVYLRFSKEYKIIEFRSGPIPEEQYFKLVQRFQDPSFHNLKDEYHLPPPEKGCPPLEYEDAYYFLTRMDANCLRSVFAHEYAAPRPLNQTIKAMSGLRDFIPEAPLECAFLISFPRSLFSCLRQDEGLRALTVKDLSIPNKYPALRESIRLPGFLVKISTGSGNQWQKELFKASNLRKLISGSSEMALILLVK